MSTDTAAPPAPAARTLLLVRATRRGFYHASPGTHNGMADKEGWSIHQHVRNPGDTFLIKRVEHFAPEYPTEERFGWMEWADQTPSAQPEPPAMTATQRIQDPLSIGMDARMIPQAGMPHGTLAPLPPGQGGTGSRDQFAENAALSAFPKTAPSAPNAPQGSQVPLQDLHRVAEQPRPKR